MDNGYIRKSNPKFNMEIYKPQGRHDYNPNTLKNINSYSTEAIDPLSQMNAMHAEAAHAARQELN